MKPLCSSPRSSYEAHLHHIGLFHGHHRGADIVPEGLRGSFNVVSQLVLPGKTNISSDCGSDLNDFFQDGIMAFFCLTANCLIQKT